MLIFDMNENEQTYNKQIIYLQNYINNERIKSEYIPSYISENGI